MLYQTSKTDLFIRFILRSLRQDKLYLFPLRLFIGIGWLRAGLEKWPESGWHDGSSLAYFLETHAAEGQIVFPFYQQLVETTFGPASSPLGFTIMVCQFLVGVAILTGTLTNLALLGGIFMNLNFILVGEVDPSTFYIVIQIVLLLSHSGTVFGLDYFLGQKIRASFLVAKPSTRPYSRSEKVVMGLVVALCLLAAFAVLPSIAVFGPSSVEDPAMICLILSLFTAAFFLLTLLNVHFRSVYEDFPTVAESTPSPYPLPERYPDTRNRGVPEVKTRFGVFKKPHPSPLEKAKNSGETSGRTKGRHDYSNQHLE